jgi:putative DNA primase/helicase
LWQAEGLGTPTAVLEATAAYRRDSDAIGDFLAEACALDAEAEVPAAELYRAYVAWADRQGLADRERLTQTMFGRKVSERFRKTHTRDGARYHGVAVNAAGGFC